MIGRGLILPTFFAIAGCASNQLPEVMHVRHVSPARGAPGIESVRDLGTGRVPERGRLVARQPDGKGVIGELLLIQGSGFGKQPTVTIGKRSTAVLAHTEGGGVVVRVPWGIDPGVVDVEVSHDAGRHHVSFPVLRRGLVVTEKGLQVIDVGAGGAVKAGRRVPLPGARKVVYSHDGSVAYVAGKAGTLKIWIVDMTAPSPRVVDSHDIPGARLIDLATASQSTLGVAVSDTHIVYFDNKQMLNPAFYSPHAIPREVIDRKILAAAIGGQGRTVGVLLADLNMLALFDASRPSVPDKPRLVDVLPDARLQVVTDLGISGDGTSIWVASSDNPRSIAGGFQPARLTQLQVSPAGKGPLTATVHQTWSLGDKLSVVTLALARGEPIPPGTSIRSAPSSSVVYLSSFPSGLLKERLGSLGSGAGGKLIRSSLAQKSGELIATGPWLLTSLDVVGKSQVMVALGCMLNKGKLTRALLHGKAWRGGKPETLLLDPVSAAALKRQPLWLGTVAAQP